MKDPEFEAMTRLHADEALIEKTLSAAKTKKEKSLHPVLRITAGIAAALLLVMIPLTLLRGRRNAPILSNPWERSDFRAVTLGFTESADRTASASFASFGRPGTPEILRLSEQAVTELSDPVPTEALAAEEYRLPSLGGTLTVESLLHARYLLYYDRDGLPQIYDLETGQSTDLTERVFGRRVYLPETLHAPLLARLQAEGWYDPEADADGRVARFLYHVLQTQFAAFDVPLPFTQLEGAEAKDALIDVSYLASNPECASMTDPQRKEALFSKAWSLAFEIVRDDLSSYTVSVPVVDAASGRCLLALGGIGGLTGVIYSYDIARDSLEGPIEDRSHTLDYELFRNGTDLRFKSDGTMLLSAAPHFSSLGWPKEDDADIEFASYAGEEIGLVDLRYGFTYVFSPSELADGGVIAPRASGAARVSASGNYLCYRASSWSGGAKHFFVPKQVFDARFTLVPHDDDQWFFVRLRRENGALHNDGDPLTHFTLPGTFVRFSEDEAMIVMKQGSHYHIYSAEDGKEITSSVRSGGRMLFAHEYFDVYEQGGSLLRRHIFTGETETLLTGDALCVSENGAFVFGYRKGEKSATCMNVASLESAQIALGDDFVRDLNAARNVAFDFLYNEESNTLTLTFRESEAKADGTTVDFFGLTDNPGLDGECFEAYSLGGTVLPALILGDTEQNPSAPSETGADVETEPQNRNRDIMVR